MVDLLRGHTASPAAAAQANNIAQADKSGFGAPAAQQVHLCLESVLTARSMLELSTTRKGTSNKAISAQPSLG